MHLQSRTAAFRLQFVQRLLIGPVDSNWRSIAFTVLQCFGSLGMDKTLFWLNPKKMDLSKLPIFYRNVFKVWTLFTVQRPCGISSLYWLLQEPLVCGSRMDISLEGPFPALNGILLSSKVTTLGCLLQSAGKDFKHVDLVAGHLGLHSKRTVAKLFEQWRAALTAEEIKLLEDYSEGLIVPNSDDPFPVLSFISHFRRL